MKNISVKGFLSLFDHQIFIGQSRPRSILTMLTLEYFFLIFLLTYLKGNMSVYIISVQTHTVSAQATCIPTVQITRVILALK